MKFKSLILTMLIIGTMFIGLAYFLNHSKIPLPKSFIDPLEQRANQIKLSLDRPIYLKDRHWLAVMFQEANEQLDYDEKQKIFQKVIAAALSVNDYNIALLSALQMATDDVPVHQSRVDMLDLIIDKAIQTETTLDYAYFAVNQYPTCSSKAKAKPKVIEAYTEFTHNNGIFTATNLHMPSETRI